jgi:hypothetical protein
MRSADDVKTNPRPGDEIFNRLVVEVTWQGLVVYRHRQKKTLSSLRFVGPSTWQAWAQGKEVLHVAD